MLHRAIRSMGFHPRKMVPLLAAAAFFASDSLLPAAEKASPAPADGGELRLVTIDPGHFHAALLQKERLPGVSDRARIYAPLGPDLAAHLNRIARFNARKENPTAWQLEVYAGDDFWQKALREPPGGIAVLSGNNRGKIDRINALVDAGQHVLADKPWIIEPADLAKVEAALDLAQSKGVAVCDAMTQRFEISCILCRELVNEFDVFGYLMPGTIDQPAVRMESVHHLVKQVAGAPIRRPARFFDIRQQGKGLADAGTHLVDLVQWTLFPDRAIDYRNEIRVLRGAHWPTVLTRADFQRVTGEAAFPPYLADAVRDDRLEYFANNRVSYTLRDIHVRLDVRWELEAQPGAHDSQYAMFRGAQSIVEVRQGAEEEFRPEIYVTVLRPGFRLPIREALERWIRSIQPIHPGLAMRDEGQRLHVIIPDQYRIGHEAHFAPLTKQFLEYVKNPRSLPEWEKPNMLAKYYVTTEGIALARRSPADKASP